MSAAVSAFVKQRVGSVKTPKQIEVWDDLPRSKVGKVLKSENPCPGCWRTGRHDDGFSKYSEGMIRTRTR